MAFNRRQCGCDSPRTSQEYIKVYHGLEEIFKRLLKPHYGAFKDLVTRLMQIRHEMTAWERDTFLPDIHRKMDNRRSISPAMVKKTREIAHKCGVECGFPSLKELGAAYSRPREPERRVSNG